MATLLQIGLVGAPNLLGAAVTVALFITSLNLIRRLFSNASIPSDLPWAGVGKYGNRLGRVKGNLTSIFHLKDLLNEGYAKASPLQSSSVQRGRV